jgi:hypothetical protein
VGSVDSDRRGGIQRRAAAAMLVGALGSAREDLRRATTCAPQRPWGVSGVSMTMGNGWTTRERAAKMTGMQVSGVECEDTRCDRRWVKGTTRQPHERAVGERGGRSERPHCFGAEQVSI